MSKTVAQFFRSSNDATFLTQTFYKYKGEWVFSLRDKTKMYDTPWAMRLYKLDNLPWDMSNPHLFTPSFGVDMAQVPLTDVEFVKPDLGYINYPGHAKYLKAVVSGGPYASGGTVGLAWSALRINNNPVPNEHIKFYASCPAFQDCLNNTYPTVQKAWEMVGAPAIPTNWNAVAISRDLCLVRASLAVVMLYHKDTKIGELMAGGPLPTLTLYPAYYHLKRKINLTGLENVSTNAN